MTRYLRAKTNGIIFEWNERIAANPDVEEVSEKEAFPERFAPVDLKARPVTINLDVPAEAVAKPEVSPELAAQRGTTFSNLATPKPIKNKKATAADIAGLAGEF